MDKTNFEELKFNLLEGRFPKNSNEIVISNHIKSNGEVELNVGDKVSFDVGSRINLEGEELKNSVYIQGEEKLVNTKKYDFTVVRNYR